LEISRKKSRKSLRGAVALCEQKKFQPGASPDGMPPVSVGVEFDFSLVVAGQ
jgi:hypothetical protein